MSKVFVRSVSLPEHVYYALDEYQKQGGNVSALVTKLLEEYFFGPQVDKADDKALYKIIQLENKLQELKEEQTKKIEELEREILILKQAYEKQLEEKRKREEERRRKEEEERRKKRLEEIQNELREYVVRFNFAKEGKTIIYHQIKKIIKNAVEEGFSEKELWEFCFERSTQLKKWVETDIRRQYV